MQDNAMNFHNSSWLERSLQTGKTMHNPVHMLKIARAGFKASVD
jgi:hypothetical protein